MNKALEYSLLGLALAIGATAAAYAEPRHHDFDPPRPKRRTAPEVDPNLAIGGLSLIGGTLAVLLARRRKLGESVLNQTLTGDSQSGRAVMIFPQLFPEVRSKRPF